MFEHFSNSLIYLYHMYSTYNTHATKIIFLFIIEKKTNFVYLLSNIFLNIAFTGNS